MRRLIKLDGYVLLTLAVGACGGRSYGQNSSIYEPVATGFQVPRVAGTLNTSVSASQRIVRGYNGISGAVYFTDISGNAGYISQSVAHPFSMIYGGGYMFSTTNQPSSFFHSLALSQVLTLPRWSFVIADDVAYLPQSPVGGFSGVAGLGVLGINPIQPGGGNGLQSNYGPRVTNTVSGSVIRLLTPRTSVAGNGLFDLIRFPSSVNGIETTGEQGGATLTHHTDARTTVTGQYDFNRLEYPQYGLKFHAHTLLLGVSRQWTQNWITSAGAGPLFTTDLSGKSSVNYSVNGKAAYDTPRYQSDLSFVRAVSSGSGVTTASVSNHASALVTRQFDPFTSLSLSLNYNHLQTLPSKLALQYSTSNVIGSAQFTRAISRKLSAYVSYSGQHQTVDQSTFFVNALQGTTQTFAFGLTYSPRPILFGSP